MSSAVGTGVFITVSEGSFISIQCGRPRFCFCIRTSSTRIDPFGTDLFSSVENVSLTLYGVMSAESTERLCSVCQLVISHAQRETRSPIEIEWGRSYNSQHYGLYGIFWRSGCHHQHSSLYPQYVAAVDWLCHPLVAYSCSSWPTRSFGVKRGKSCSYSGLQRFNSFHTWKPETSEEGRQGNTFRSWWCCITRNVE